MECNKWITSSIIAGHLIVIGIILLIIGAQMPGYTNQVLQAGVKASLQKNRAEMGEEKWADWLTSESDYDVYVFNVTNAADIIANGAKPIVQQIKFEMTQHKEFLDFSVVGDEGQFIDYGYTTAKEGVNLDTKIITVNPVYLTATSAPPAGSEAALFIGIGQSVVANLGGAFMDPAGPLLSAFRVLAVSTYFAVMSGTPLLNATTMPRQWNGRQHYGQPMTTVAQSVGAPQLVPLFGGFELSQAIPQPIADALLSPASPISLRNDTGLKTWLGSISQPCTGTCVGATAYLNATFISLAGNDATVGSVAFGVVKLWLARLTQLTATSTPPGFRDTSFFLAIKGALTPLLGLEASSCNSWGDLGAFQWGTGMIVVGLSGGLSNSVTQLGLPVPFAKAPEISAWAASIGQPGFKLGVNASKAFFAAFSNAALSAAWFGAVATQNPAQIGALLQNPAFSPIAAGRDLNNTAWIQWISLYAGQYLPLEFVIKPTILGPINEKGLGSNNGGLFIERSVREVLFGYADPFSPTYPGLLGKNLTREQRRSNFIGWGGMNLGTADINKLGLVTQWRSLKRLELRSDLKQPCPNNNASNCKAWKQAEQIAGKPGYNQYPPFQQDKTPAASISLWAPEIYRTVSLGYVRENKLKGVTLRRYTIDDSNLVNSTVNPNNANYYMDGPSYLAPMAAVANDAPVWLSFPRQMKVLPEIRANVQGQTPDDWETISLPALETFVEVEPITGVVMNGGQRLQYNIAVKHSVFKDSPLYSKVAANAYGEVIYWPLAWIDKHGQLTDSDAASFKTKIQDQLDMAEKITILGEVLGPILIVLGGVATAFICSRGRKQMGLS